MASSWLNRTVGSIATALDDLDNQVEGLLDQTPERSKIEARASRRPKYVSRSDRPRFPTPTRKLNDDQDKERLQNHINKHTKTNASSPLNTTISTSSITSITTNNDTITNNNNNTITNTHPTNPSNDETHPTNPISNTSATVTHNFTPLPSVLLDDDILAMMQDENNRLKDRIRAQDAELEAMDAQLLDTQDDLEKLELTHSSYCDDAEAREKTMAQNVKQLEIVASSSTNNVQSVLEKKDKEIDTLQLSLEEIESSHEASLTFLRQQLEDVTLENEALEEKCQEYKGQSRDVGEGRAQILSELRQDLLTMEEQRRTEHEKHARVLKESQQRERTVQSVNNELTRALSNAERHSETLSEKINKMERNALLRGDSYTNSNNNNNNNGNNNNGSNGSDNQGSSSSTLHQNSTKLNQLQKELNDEKENVQRTEREIRALKHELALSKTTADTMQRRTDMNLLEKKEIITRLELKISELNGTSINNTDAGRQELRDQLNILTERVLTQQSTIETLTSQRVMLQQSNVELKEGHQTLTLAVRRHAQLQDDGMDVDLEDGGSYGLSQRTQKKYGSRNASGGSVEDQRNGNYGHGNSNGSGRTVASLTSIRQLRPILARNKTLANAVRGLDRFVFLAMGVIRRFPTARLFFLVWMLTLHVWSIFLVSHHTSCSGVLVKGSGGGMGGGHGNRMAGAMPAVPPPPR